LPGVGPEERAKFVEYALGRTLRGDVQLFERALPLGLGNPAPSVQHLDRTAKDVRLGALLDTVDDRLPTRCHQRVPALRRGLGVAFNVSSREIDTRR
jgi:hypothetical protein